MPAPDGHKGASECRQVGGEAGQPLMPEPRLIPGRGCLSALPAGQSIPPPGTLAAGFRPSAEEESLMRGGGGGLPPPCVDCLTCNCSSFALTTNACVVRGWSAVRSSLGGGPSGRVGMLAPGPAAGSPAKQGTFRQRRLPGREERQTAPKRGHKRHFRSSRLPPVLCGRLQLAPRFGFHRVPRIWVSGFPGPKTKQG